MNDKKAKPKRRIGRWIVGFLLLLLVSAAGASYAMGWVTVRQGDGRLTIEIKTGEAKQDTDQAVKQGKRAVEKTGKALQETGKAVQEAGKKVEKLGGDDDASKQDNKATDSPTSQDTDATKEKTSSNDAPSVEKD